MGWYKAKKIGKKFLIQKLLGFWNFVSLVDRPSIDLVGIEYVNWSEIYDYTIQINTCNAYHILWWIADHNKRSIHEALFRQFKKQIDISNAPERS